MRRHNNVFPHPAMPGIFPVVGSLDMVHLSKELADFLRIPTGKPFVSDVVIVDGKGTSNWLTHALVRGGKMQVQLNAQLLNSRRVGGWLASVIGTAELARLKGEEPQPVGHNAADHLAGLPTAMPISGSTRPSQIRQIMTMMPAAPLARPSTSV